MNNKKAVIFGKPQQYGRKNYAYPVSYTDPLTGDRKYKKYYTPEEEFSVALAKIDYYKAQFLTELAAQNRDKSPVIPIYKFFERYFSEEGNKLAKSTRKDYHRYCERLMKHFDRNTPLNSINRNKANLFLRSFSSNSSADGARRSLRAVFRHAAYMELIEVNPFDNIKPIQWIKKKREYLRDDNREFAKFYEMLPENTYVQKTFKNMALLGNATGMRSSELRNLRLANIDLTNRKINIEKTKVWDTKNHRNRPNNLTDDAIIAIKNQLRDKCSHKSESVRESEFLFANNKGKVYDVSRISRLFHEHKMQMYPEREGLKFHSLRHTLGQNSYNEGMELEDIAAQLGHASKLTTERYYARQEDYSMSEKGLEILNSRRKVSREAVPEELQLVTRGENVSLERLLQLLTQETREALLKEAPFVQEHRN